MEIRDLAIPPLIELLGDRSSNVRSAATFTISRMTENGKLAGNCHDEADADEQWNFVA